MVIMEKCVRKGIVLHCIKEGYTFDDTINSKVLCFAFGLVAEIERKRWEGGRGTDSMVMGSEHPVGYNEEGVLVITNRGCWL